MGSETLESLQTPAGSSTGLVPKLHSPLASTFSLNSKLGIATKANGGGPYSNSESRFGGTDSSASLLHMSDKYSLAPDPKEWGSDLSPNLVEDDDYIHNPSPRDKVTGFDGTIFTSRGFANVGCLTLLMLLLLGLFAGYPVTSHFLTKPLSTNGGFNIGGINASGQLPSMAGNFALIDNDTPSTAYSKPSWSVSGQEMELVFSDEFTQDGRTFYPGDDPYWEAADLYYWVTNDLEWYDPSAITTKDGKLVITMSNTPSHNLSYMSGMMTTWNKFCFTGGYIETAVSLPGVDNVIGFWPAVWTLGNLGRAGYGASLEGMWPYSYDTCDVGTVANQSVNGQPPLALQDGDPTEDGALNFLPGQRLSRCTCSGESHPGPAHSDGTYFGRGAPEIDIFEAQITRLTTGAPLTGQVSQSAQWAPFNYAYDWQNTSANLQINDPTITSLNTFVGNVLQQCTSSITDTNPDCYTHATGCFSVYGFEYKPGFDGAYITWVANNQSVWTIQEGGMGPDPRVNLTGSRPVPQEPMYIIMNFGMSQNFAKVDLTHLIFPNTMEVDYVRVYQPKDAKNIGCDPPDFPTADYINTYIEAYTNPNLTTWTGPADEGGFGQTWPKNKFLGQC